MNITGMLYGAPLLKHVDFPSSEVLGPEATEEEIQSLIDRHKLILIKPVFRGGVGKKGKAGLIGRASDLKTALKEKERLYFIEHQHGKHGYYSREAKAERSRVRAAILTIRYLRKGPPTLMRPMSRGSGAG